jgi:hypothetical protein
MNPFHPVQDGQGNITPASGMAPIGLTRIIYAGVVCENMSSYHERRLWKTGNVVLRARKSKACKCDDICSGSRNGNLC